MRRSILGICALAAAHLAGCAADAPMVAELPPPPVTVAKPVVRPVTDYDAYEGRFEAREKVDVRARVGGYLTKVFFKNGQRVEEGSPLYQIDPRPYQASLDAARAEKAAAEASLELATAEFKRTEQLVATSAASRSELDQWTAKQAVAKADSLRADARIAQATLDLEFTKIASPISGKVGRTSITEGNLVSASGDQILTTVVSIDPMYVRFEVDERHLLEYRRNAAKKRGEGAPPVPLSEAKIPVFVGLDGESGFPHEGVIESAEVRVTASTGTTPVLATLPNPHGTFDDGMRARVRVPVSDPYDAILVADRAVLNDRGHRFVYVVGANNRVERRDVRLGRSHDGLQAVASGLGRDDWVVVNGLQRVREGIEVAPQQASMPGGDEAAARPAAAGGEEAGPQ
jgi:RND family efflux transporter MFP subunit